MMRERKVRRACVAAAFFVLAGCGGERSPSDVMADPPMPPPPTLPQYVGAYARIPAGTFTMGSPPNEAGRIPDETQHSVTITHDFWLKTTEVTQLEWHSLMGTLPSYFAVCGDNCPVERVSWWDAIAYVNALSRASGLEECYTLSECSGMPGSACSNKTSCTGDYRCGSVRFAGVGCLGYRLPTEAEWEYAARAGTPTAFYTGDLTGDTNTRCAVDRNLEQAGWYCGNSKTMVLYDAQCSRDPQCTATHEAGQKAPNAWGLFDVHGNVAEWVHDWYGPYGAASTRDPIGPITGTNRVKRGGHWFVNAEDCRSASRVHTDPALRFFGAGFRPARSIP